MAVRSEWTLVPWLAGHRPGITHVDRFAGVSTPEAALTIASVDVVVGIDAVAKCAVGRFEGRLGPRVVLSTRVVFAPAPHKIFAPLWTVLIRIPPQALTVALWLRTNAIAVHVLAIERALPPTATFPVDSSAGRLDVKHFAFLPHAAASFAGPGAILLQTLTLAFALESKAIEFTLSLQVEMPLPLAFALQLACTGAVTGHSAVIVEGLLSITVLLTAQVRGVDDILGLVHNIAQAPFRLWILLFLVVEILDCAPPGETFLDIHRLIVIGVEVTLLGTVMVVLVVEIAAAFITLRWRRKHSRPSPPGVRVSGSPAVG